MGFLEKAKAFIQAKSKQKQAFYDREHELRTKLTELESKKSKLYSEYDPTKKFNQDALDKIENEIDVISKELAILTTQKEKVADYAFDELIKHVNDAKTEAKQLIADRLPEEEKARQKIADAKLALLKAQAEHFTISREIKEFAAETNESIEELTTKVKHEVERLRARAQQIGLEIYRSAPDGSTTMTAQRTDQYRIDMLQEELSQVRKEIASLESMIGDVAAPIQPLSGYTDSNNRTVYFVHANEQYDAAEKGILPK